MQILYLSEFRSRRKLEADFKNSEKRTLGNKLYNKVIIVFLQHYPQLRLTRRQYC